jgi:hypothetical protein
LIATEIVPIVATALVKTSSLLDGLKYSEQVPPKKEALDLQPPTL